MLRRIPNEFTILTLHRYRGTAGPAFDERLDGPSLRPDLLQKLGRGIHQRSRRMVPRRLIEISIASMTAAATAISLSAMRLL